CLCSVSGRRHAPLSFPARRSSDLLGRQVDQGEEVHHHGAAGGGGNPLHRGEEVQVLVGRESVVETEEVRHVAEMSPDISGPLLRDRKSTRLNSSHVKISYAGFCLK